ncbi:MAG TPA: hypothetical protein VJ276_21840 [Thermoanaerobaculia bacterium]|nr:hypothetical protein [Thermoanaerobaculia bacterium]
MKAFAVRRGEEHPDLIGAMLCHDVPGLFRKGHALRAEDIPLLIDAPWSELHLLQLERDDVPQREAGGRLARMLAAPGLEIAPAGHRHVLRAQHDGLLKIDVEALRRLNGVHGIAVFTLRSDAVVAKGEIVAEAQITPLAIGREELEEAEAIGPVLRLLPFRAREAVLLARDDRAVRGLSAKLARFGCELRQVVPLPAEARSIRAALESRPEPLFVVCGSNALDPLDPVFVALESMGATMQRRGMPVHPGTLLWIATWKERTIIGLPSCGFASQLTAFDLVLPRLLAGDPIDYAGLGHGGIVKSTDRQPTTDDRPQAHDTVR